MAEIETETTEIETAAEIETATETAAEKPRRQRRQRPDGDEVSQWPTRVKMVVGDGAIFDWEEKKRKVGDSIRVGVIHYALSPIMTVPFTLYKRVPTGQTSGGRLSLAMPKGIDLHGFDRRGPEVSAWLESETLAWVAWFKAHGSKVPTAVAVTKGFSGVSVDF